MLNVGFIKIIIRGGDYLVFNSVNFQSPLSSLINFELIIDNFFLVRFLSFCCFNFFFPFWLLNHRNVFAFAKSHCLASGEFWVQPCNVLLSCLMFLITVYCTQIQYLFNTNLVSSAPPPKLFSTMNHRGIRLMLMSFFK